MMLEVPALSSLLDLQDISPGPESRLKFRGAILPATDEVRHPPHYQLVLPFR